MCEKTAIHPFALRFGSAHTSRRGDRAHRPSAIASHALRWPMAWAILHLCANDIERWVLSRPSCDGYATCSLIFSRHAFSLCVCSALDAPDRRTYTPLHNVQAPAFYPSLPCATKACKSSVFLYCAIARCAAVSLRALDGAARLICSASGGVASLGDSRLLLTLHL